MDGANLVVSGASLVLSAAQTVLAALQNKELREICSLWGYESELESLQNTVDTIKSVLLDAEAKQVLSHQQLNYVQKLKDAVYKADDLLDEFTALAEQQQQQLLKGGNVPKKVRLLFSPFGKLGVLRKMSENVKEIKKEFDSIASDANKFSFKIDYEPIRRRREESCSCVNENYVIGREKETEEIINMLLAPDTDSDAVQQNLSVVVIVGIGGLGKTTLAQHVYDHDKVKSEFPLRLWACVSDHQDKKQLLLQPILVKILESATSIKQDHGSGIELLQRQLRETLQGNKYLLVLDDIWTEDRDEWLELEKFLVGGGRGSKVLITTRSKETAQAVGSITPYELHELSEQNSLLLFERVAFGKKGRKECHELEDIGKDIIKNCANVPLAIRVAGSLLYGKGKKKWLEFKQHGLAMLRHRENRIMQILKLSYLHLPPSLKSCFSYCAIFPKDSVIKKETLISLWMAQGFVEPFPGIQSIEDACEEYFLILLQRCFFQDVQKDEFGEIFSCKMHDLMHDMAQEVAINEICIVDSATSSLDKRIRHVYHVCHGDENDLKESFCTDIDIRTYLGMRYFDSHTQFPVNIVLEKYRYLRVLHLCTFNIQCLPEAIGKLLHLRYLDVSHNSQLKKLPKSITRLHYLQTLNIRGCEELKELPKDFSKLDKLRLLDVEGTGLTSMPTGMAKLTCLRRLSMFVVSRNSRLKQEVSNLEDLRVLRDLKGHLIVKIKGEYRYGKKGSRVGGYLRDKKHLNDIGIEYEGRVEGEEVLLEDLQPNDEVKRLRLSGYGGVRIPTWAKQENLKMFLPNLFQICLKKCKGLKELPSLSELQHLKFIEVCELENLEYMENTSKSDPRSAATSFFPSLEVLELRSLPNLRRWNRGSESGVVSFPCLSKLTIWYCPNLTSIPLCPTVENLTLWKFNERIRIMDAENERHPKLTRVEIDNAAYLKNLSMTAFSRLMTMRLTNNKEMERLSEVGEVLQTCSSSLKYFELGSLPKLRRLSGEGVGLEHHTALESLTLYKLFLLRLHDEEDGMPWRCLHRLHSLTLVHLPRVVKLPTGMQHLTSLQSLYIKDVYLEAMPDWIGCLSSLQFLHIEDCERIESLPGSMGQLTSLTHFAIRSCSKGHHQRCKSPNGEDWPLIQHIPYLDIN